MVTNLERAVYSFDHLGLRLGLAVPFGTGQELQRTAVVLDCVVAGDSGGAAEGEDSAQVERRLERKIGRLGLRLLNPEAGVEAWKEAVEHGLRFGDRRSASVMQLGHEPVLERSARPLACGEQAVGSLSRIRNAT